MKKSLVQFSFGVIFLAIQSVSAQQLSVRDTPPNRPASRKEEQMYMQPANSREEFERNYAWRIEQKTLSGVYIPTDLLDAFRELDKKTDAASKAKFRAMTEPQAEEKLAWSLGRWMTVNWHFYEGSRFAHWFRQAGITFPEDMAAITIVAYHRQLMGRDLQIKELLEKYKEKRRLEHEAWLKKNGIDPKTVVDPKKIPAKKQ